MKLVSWNVNGLRACLKKGFTDSIQQINPDILCLQETKLGRDAPPELALPELPFRIFHSADKPGYSGTALLSRKEPITVELDFGDKAFRGEGRVIAAEFDSFFLVNSYVPNSQNELRRLDYRCGSWEPRTRAYLSRLATSKPVFYCGDLNVAHREIDLARPEANRRNAGFTDEERREMDQLIASGFTDSFRHFHPDEENRYSWWSYRAGARKRNVGWRLDYFLVSESGLGRMRSADIFEKIEGSDHCPVSLELD
jgi:exodeoxyribonuclease-3